MPILNRKCTQSIKIGDGIEVKVLKITPKTVTLGLTAPGELRIRREELKPEKSEEE